MLRDETPPSKIHPANVRFQAARRSFCLTAGALLAGGIFWSRMAHAQQTQTSHGGTPTRPDVEALDRDRILRVAAEAMKLAPAPITSLRSPRSPGTPHDFYSEAAVQTSAEPVSASDGTPFRAHADAVFSLGLTVPALIAAYVITSDKTFAERAAVHLRVWFIDPATRMTPRLEFGRSRFPAAPERLHVTTQSTMGTMPDGPVYGSFEGVLETVPLVEIAQAIPFLAASDMLSHAETDQLRGWFAAYLRWLVVPQDSGPRLAALARDQKNHHGSSWLLQTAAYARLTAAEDIAAELRHRFKTVTIRAQINANGTFPQELATANPYRNSLFNLDMLAAACDLLSTRFENVWEYSLQDGPGMRSAIAFHFPFIENKGLWPYRADIEHFNQLPGRRICLLLSARRYTRPEYAHVWSTSHTPVQDEEVERTLPVHQPLLWVRQPTHES